MRPSEFYRGKQIQILVAGTAGGGIDIGARIVARHLGKHIAGQSDGRACSSCRAPAASG